MNDHDIEMNTVTMEIRHGDGLTFLIRLSLQVQDWAGYLMRPRVRQVGHDWS